MSFAVQTDNGLMAPTLKNANMKGLEQIAFEVRISREELEKINLSRKSSLEVHSLFQILECMG
jgi:pyruvate/2-oxoglutarate dehydrogenase complex dihydrolipoamide acyltransferase (E2) component